MIVQFLLPKGRSTMAPRSILVINPNSTASITDGLKRMLEPLVPADVCPPSAPASINDSESSARSADACLPTLISFLPHHAGFVVACYSEHPLVPLLRQYTKKPVVGIFEASITHALLLKGPGGWGIVTTGKIWEDLLSIGVGNFVGEEGNGFEGVESTGMTATELHSVEEDEVKSRIGEAVVRLVGRGDVRVICLGVAMGLKVEWFRTASLTGLLLRVVAASLLASQNLELQDAPPIEFSDLWHQLGPFQIGTRETEWGSDPLERYGGFRTLEPDRASAFRSSLARNGTVKWTTAASVDKTRHAVSLSISFPETDWDMMQSAYGWAGLQFQAWLRGHFDINPRLERQGCGFALHTKQVQEFWIDGDHYFGGDVYGYGKSPVGLHLDKEQKRHVIDIRIFNGIRMFGGRKPPRVDIELAFEDLCGTLDIIEEASVFPDIVGGKSAGEFATLAVRNNGNISLDILGAKSESDIVELKLVEVITIAPSQTRPVRLKLSTSSSLKSLDGCLIYRQNDAEDAFKSFQIPLTSLAEPYAPHKFTYAHPAGIISYGVIRPPSLRSDCGKSEDLPILLSLHGAGVETNSAMSRNSFDSLPDLCAWLIIPSGVTPWSGDDWHAWGMADVEAAIAAIPDWIDRIGWNGPGVDINRWFVSGHSNGGQGAWYNLIHRNDKVIGGSPISGYLSIPGYVPYVLWQELEPCAQSILQGSMNAYRLDLLVENLAGIPIFQEHGEADDNVPVFHSRRMFELLHDTVQAAGLDNIGYNELPRTGHWFDGIMTYGAMGDFLSDFFRKPRTLAPLNRSFAVVTGNPGAMSSRGGLRILQLLDPNVLGRLKVEIEHTNVWRIKTTNVRRFELDFSLAELRTTTKPLEFIIDGNKLSIATHDGIGGFIRDDDDEWTGFDDNIWKESERHGLQLGGLQALFNSRGSIKIFRQPDSALSLEVQKKAMEISQNLFQYYSADTELLLSAKVHDGGGTGNVVLIGGFDRSYLPEGLLRSSFPVSQSEDGSITFRLATGKKIIYPCQPGLGLILVFPLGGTEKVGIWVWGSDAEGLRRATRLFPIRTGVSQPDFILLGPDSGWKGAAGALALGVFDSKWQITSSSYFRRE
ncbi:hypothetical protein Dda_2975 [Drechslerella dactyloides]|uniref:Peptidase S9 prolyl oligopeptidase catalytic domain-containing protein n=1 Tax=Drechslerella dactyloides TaxID=74499 RepID=A0AAD6J2T8_DREDA|nr:hypothetical protein Dda_2975 [Drechslerella dactyloides]